MKYVTVKNSKISPDREVIGPNNDYVSTYSPIWEKLLSFGVYSPNWENVHIGFRKFSQSGESS